MRIPAGQILSIAASILLALLLWLWVGAQEKSEIVLSAPLQYRNLPRGYEIVATSELITNVNIWIKGTTATIRNLRPQEITAWVDLENTKPGDKNYELTPDQVRVPYGFSVLRISPSRVRLKVEQAITRMVPVTVQLVGEPPLGYSVTETTIIPSMAQIRGPQSAVASVRQVITDSIDVSSIQGNHQEIVNIGVENSAVRLEGAKTVRVTLTVSEIRDVASLRIPIRVTGTNSGAKLNPKTLRVEFLGPKKILALLSEKNVSAVIEASDMKPGVYELTPRIILEPDLEKKVSVKDVTPQRVHVRIL